MQTSFSPFVTPNLFVTDTSLPGASLWIIRKGVRTGLASATEGREHVGTGRQVRRQQLPRRCGDEVGSMFDLKLLTRCARPLQDGTLPAFKIVRRSKLLFPFPTAATVEASDTLSVRRRIRCLKPQNLPDAFDAVKIISVNDVIALTTVTSFCAAAFSSLPRQA